MEISEKIRKNLFPFLSEEEIKRHWEFFVECHTPLEEKSTKEEKEELKNGK